MVLEGKIKSGFGEAKIWVKRVENIFNEKENIKLFLGTLNIQLASEYTMDNPDFTIDKKEYNGTEKLYTKKCKILGHNSYIIRTQKNSGDNGDHPLNIIEILSDINFREKYNLKDNDKIKVII